MRYSKYLIIIQIIFIISGLSFPQAQSAEPLPKPNIKDSNTFLSLLTQRRSHRNFSSRDISRQQLSEILWAAYGVADEVSGKRTVPSSYAGYEISVYVLNQNGLYLYLPESHSLKKIHGTDIRKYAGLQSFVSKAPLTLIYAADFDKMSANSRNLTEDKKYFLAAANTGFIAQNVYLYCASAGLGTVVRDWINRDLLAEKMGISKTNQKIILGQTIGYPESD